MPIWKHPLDSLCWVGFSGV